VSKIFKESIKKIKMKKLFALLMVAGTLSLYSCGGEKKVEETVDSTAVETTTETTVMDTAAAVVDTAAAAVDTAAAAAPAH
jgi:hypothetical protein